MKKSFALLLLSLIFMLANNLLAQDVKLNTITNTDTVYRCGNYFYDDGGATGNYSPNYDYWITLCPTNNTSRVQLTFESADIDVSDSMYFYSGTGITSSSIANPTGTPDANGLYPFSSADLLLSPIMPSLLEPSGCITVRFISNATNVKAGWKAKMECVSQCQYPEASLDTFFIKYDGEGNMSTRPVRSFVDTVWKDTANHTAGYTLSKYKAVDFCIGDSIILVANTIFPENNASYAQHNEDCIFYWDFGDNNKDTTFYSTKIGHKWMSIDGYNLGLTVLDTNHGGCKSRNAIDTRIRIAKNPIKTVSPLPDMCSGETFILNVGYTGNSSVIIDSLEFKKEAKERFDSTIFIPDGPNCGGQSYFAPVYFDQFRNGEVLTSVNEVLSLCMNIEHSFAGDLGYRLYCPNGTYVWLSFNRHNNGNLLGVPNDPGGNCCAIDLSTPGGNCYPGIGWTYCWSNQYLNNSRGIFNDVGAPGGTTDSTHVSDSSGYWQTPTQGVQTFSANGDCQTNCNTVDLNGFWPLLGCPLNGEWNLEVIDNFGADNGFVFWWDLSLGIGSGANWDYQVGLDTVIWNGPFMHSQTSNSSQITPPIESCDTYRYDIHIVDDFGCVWDTATSLKVVCTPVVNLGPDTAICEQMNVVLDAGNPGATGYIWEPTGETTQTILAKTLPNSDSKITYVAQVTNFNGSIYCYGSDSINLIVYPSALASFSMDKNPLEGCEPLSFQLFSSSTNAAQYDWTVGQLKSNEPNPSFTFPYGTYDLKLKVTSEKGCTDSIFQESIINVYKSPIAGFGWNPTNPAVSNPTINFINLTTPVDYSNQYHWKIQSNKLNDLRENIFGFEPTYTWVPIPGSNTVGNYNITLDAYSVNKAPSGRTYECHDTISKIITIINDSIMFPNVLTPNGDGVNDVLIIKNLVDGQAYPDNELSIFNRNGKRIFFKQDIRANQEIWDPAKTNTPTGTYFYKFIGRGPIRNIEYNGTIEILR